MDNGEFDEEIAKMGISRFLQEWGYFDLRPGGGNFANQTHIENAKKFIEFMKSNLELSTSRGQFTPADYDSIDPRMIAEAIENYGIQTEEDFIKWLRKIGITVRRNSFLSSERSNI